MHSYLGLKLFAGVVLGMAMFSGFYLWYCIGRAGLAALNLEPVLLTVEQHQANDSELFETARMMAEGKIAYNNSKK